MPITTSLYSGLSEDEIERLALLLEELKARGLEDKARGIKAKLELGREFHTDSSGYFVRADGKRYIPTEAQRAFIDSDARYCLFFGGRGSGKSAAGAQKALRKIAAGFSGVVFNPDFENFKSSTWPEFRSWIPWDKVIPSHRYRGRPEFEPRQPFNIVFMNGVVVRCKGLKDPDSGRGPNVNWLWFDEANRDKTGESWKVAIASVRIGEKPQAWATATPAGKQHWMYEFFFGSREDQGDSGREFVATFHGTVDENMANLDPDFVETLRLAYAPGSKFYRQEVLGEFLAEGGSLGDRAWFNGRILPYPPEGFVRRCRYWDLAASERKLYKGRRSDPDETVGTLLSWDGQEKFCLENQVHGHWEWQDIKSILVETAIKDGPLTPIYVEQEPGAGGKNQVAELIEHIRNSLGSEWKVEGHRPEGDKIMRANVWFAEAARGQFYMVKGEWNEGFLSQLEDFPLSRHDDRIDSVSGARLVLAPIRAKKWKSISFLHLGSEV